MTKFKYMEPYFSQSSHFSKYQILGNLGIKTFFTQRLPEWFRGLGIPECHTMSKSDLILFWRSQSLWSWYGHPCSKRENNSIVQSLMTKWFYVPIQKEVFWLQISVHYGERMQVIQGRDYLRTVEHGSVTVETSSAS